MSLVLTILLSSLSLLHPDAGRYCHRWKSISAFCEVDLKDKGRNVVNARIKAAGRIDLNVLGIFVITRPVPVLTWCPLPPPESIILLLPLLLVLFLLPAKAVVVFPADQLAHHLLSSFFKIDVHFGLALRSWHVWLVCLARKAQIKESSLLLFSAVRKTLLSTWLLVLARRHLLWLKCLSAAPTNSTVLQPQVQELRHDCYLE